LPLLFDALQAPLQKINLQRLLTDVALQLGEPAFFLAMQNIGVDLKRPRRVGDRGPNFQPPHGGQLELRRDKPMTPTSIRWGLTPIP